MIERSMVGCADCAGVGTFEFVEFGSPSCEACEGWGEVCSHCGQPKTRCTWQVSRLACHVPEESRSPVAAYFTDNELLMLWNGKAAIPASDGPNFGMYNKLAAEEHRNEMALRATTNKKASPQAGD